MCSEGFNRGPGGVWYTLAFSVTAVMVVECRLGGAPREEETQGEFGGQARGPRREGLGSRDAHEHFPPGSLVYS